MDTYETYKLIHVLAAVVWVGGAITTQALSLRIGAAAKAGDPGRMESFAGDVEWIGTRVFIPASLLLLVFGHLTAAEADIGFDVTWLWAGQAIWAASFLAGVAFFGPESGRLKKLIAADGWTSDVVQQRYARLILGTRVELVLLVAAVVLMVTKPT
jgi:uncharacterized membrane protein